MGANNCCNASWADPGLHRQSPLAYTSLLLWPLLLFLWVSAPDCSTCSHYNSSWFSFSVCFSLSWPFLILLLSLHSPSSLPNSLGLCKLTEKGKWSPFRIPQSLLFLHVLFHSFFYWSPSLLYLTTVSDRNPMLTTSLSADLVPLAFCPSISLGQFALCRESLLKVRTPNHQNWLCCFTVSPEKSGLSDLIKALFMGGTPLLEQDELLPLKRNLHQTQSVSHRDYIPLVNLS